MCLPKARWWAWVRPIPIDRGWGSARLEDQIAPKHDVELRAGSGKMWAIRAIAPAAEAVGMGRCDRRFMSGVGRGGFGERRGRLLTRLMRPVWT
jgi:hypothetical protein